MRIFFAVVALGLQGLDAAQVAPEIARGAAPEAVVRALGQPRSRTAARDREIWMYEGFQVMFENGGVASISGPPNAGLAPQRQPIPSLVEPPKTGAVEAARNPLVSSATATPARAVNATPPAAVPTVSSTAPARKTTAPAPSHWMVLAQAVWRPVVGVLAIAALGLLFRRWLERWRRGHKVQVARAALKRLYYAPPKPPVRVEPIPLRLDKHKNREVKSVPLFTPPAPRGTSTPPLAAPAPARNPVALSAPAPATAMEEPADELTEKLLDQLEWKRFELLTARYFNQTGARAECTCRTGEGGADIQLYHDGVDAPFGYVHCKAWTTRRVDAKMVEELLRAMTANNVKAGYLVTTGTFTADAVTFADENGITLVDSAQFLIRFNALPANIRGEILEEVTTGDYTTPTCPSCDCKMVWDPNADHWACARAPRCRSLPIYPRG